MKKNDIFLFIIIVVFALLFFLFLPKEDASKAIVRYDGKVVLEIDLKQDNTYQVEGYNGSIKILVKDKKIKVDQENSPLHICSKQGFISETYESIICLPNKIVIEISGDSSLDTVVK